MLSFAGRQWRSVCCIANFAWLLRESCGDCLSWCPMNYYVFFSDEGSMDYFRCVWAKISFLQHFRVIICLSCRFQRCLCWFEFILSLKVTLVSVFSYVIQNAKSAISHSSAPLNVMGSSCRSLPAHAWSCAASSWCCVQMGFLGTDAARRAWSYLGHTRWGLSTTWVFSVINSLCI